MTSPWTTLTKESEAVDGDNLDDFDNNEEGEREGDDDEEKREHSEQARAHPWTLVASWRGASIKIYFMYTYTPPPPLEREDRLRKHPFAGFGTVIPPRGASST